MSTSAVQIMIISKIKGTIISVCNTPTSYNFKPPLSYFFYPSKLSYACSHSSHSSNLSIPKRPHKYLQLIASLRQPQYFSNLTAHTHQLFHSVHPSGNYKVLKGLINEMLFTVQLLSWSKAYHPHANIPIDEYLTKIERMLELSFSKNIDSHETMEEEELDTFQTLALSTYFQLTAKVSPEICLLYANSYIHINQQRNILQLVKVYEALRQQQAGQIQHSILEISGKMLNQWAGQCQQWATNKQAINQVQMVVCLSHYKTKLNNINQAEKRYFCQIILKYIQNDPLQQTPSHEQTAVYQQTSSQSSLHLQNIVYSLYLALQYLQLEPQIYQWIANKLHQIPTSTIQYLLTLFAHQDKLTCLKIDIWLALQSYQKTLPKNESTYAVQQHADIAFNQLKTLNYSTWKYKYAVWMMHSLCSQTSIDLQLITKLIQAATQHTLAPHRSLSSLTSALNSLAHLVPLPQLIHLDYILSTWLTAQPEQALLSQSVDALCELLPYADRHPALHSIYLPFLSRLLELSLGRFEWTALTKLYYFGLRWGAGEGEKGRWQMEYVRRYILNEYAEMGIRRRQIPEDSYFYKILTLTTPEEFYKNHIEHA